MSDDIVGFSPQDGDSLLGLLVGGDSSRPGSMPDSGVWRFLGKLTTDVAPGASGEFVVWDVIANAATDIVIPDAYLPGTATDNAPAGTILGIGRDGYTGRWIIDTEWC